MWPRQLGMIDAEQVQHRRVKIVNVNSTCDDVVSHVVSFTPCEARLNTATCHPRAETFRLMFATMNINRCGTTEILTPRRTPKLSGPQHQSIVQQSSAFEVFDQTSNRLIGLFTESGQVASNIPMMIPPIHRHLNKTNSRFAQLASQQTGAAMFITRSAAPNAVEIECVLRLFGEINKLRRSRLHAKGKFHVFNHAFHVSVAMQIINQSLIESSSHIEAPSLNGFAGRDVAQLSMGSVWSFSGTVSGVP